MSTKDYRNQEALNKVLNIYRTCMRGFIIFHLEQIPGTTAEDIVIDSVRDWRADEIKRKLNEGMDIKSIIDIDDFPLLVVGERGINWKEVFKSPLNDDKDFQNQLWLIKTCRDQSWAHPPEGDAESEGTRAYLFLIAEVLRKIRRPDQQREVETIRDELFFDDSAERLERTKEHLESVKAENAECKRSLAEAEKRSEAAEAEKHKYEKENSALSEQVAKKENQRKKLDRQVKNAKTGNDKLKKELASTKKRLKKSEEAHNDDKESLETKSKELKDTKNELTLVQGEKSVSEKRLAFTQNLLITAAIGDQSIYPALDTNSRVRMLDRRGTDKRDYLLELLEQRRPTLIYVQSEKMAELLLTDVLPEKESVIEKHGTQTSDAEEKELLGKLASGESIAVVSNTVFSRLAPSHCVKHFVFCHLSPDLDTFFGRCQPAFTSTKNANLHLIYNAQQDIRHLDEWLSQKYPDRETLTNFYKALEGCGEINGNFIKLKNLYSKLDIAELGITELGIETGLAIFEEVEALKQNEDGIKLLPFSGRKSKIHRKGEELKEKTADFRVFQLEHSIEQIWEEILGRLNIDNEQILRENSIHQIDFKSSEIEVDAQPTKGTGQDRIIPPILNVWPQRGMSAFSILRQRASNNFAGEDATLSVIEEPMLESTIFEEEILAEESSIDSAIFEDRRNYENKYNLAIEFAEEYGVNALEQGIVELVKDQDDPDYDFTEDEKDMLRAFQDAFWNSRAQSQ